MIVLVAGINSEYYKNCLLNDKVLCIHLTNVSKIMHSTVDKYKGFMVLTLTREYPN